MCWLNDGVVNRNLTASRRRRHGFSRSGPMVCCSHPDSGPVGSHLLLVPETGPGSFPGPVLAGEAGEEPKQTPQLMESCSGPQPGSRPWAKASRLAKPPPTGRTILVSVLCPLSSALCPPCSALCPLSSAAGDREHHVEEEGSDGNPTAPSTSTATEQDLHAQLSARGLAAHRGAINGHCYGCFYF